MSDLNTKCRCLFNCGPALLFLTCFLAADVQAGEAQTVAGAEQYTDVPAPPVDTKIFRRPANIIIDGDLADWVNVPWLERPFHGTRSTCARFCWSDDGLYGAFDVTDDHVDPPQDLADTFRADGLELWIETDAARALDSTRTRFAHKIAVVPESSGDGGKARSAIVDGPLAGKTPVEAAWHRTPYGYTLEFRIPADVLTPAHMAVGAKIGFHYVLFDDAAHAEDSRIFIRGFFRKPYLWAVLRLVDSQPGSVR